MTQKVDKLISLIKSKKTETATKNKLSLDKSEQNHVQKRQENVPGGKSDHGPPGRGDHGPPGGSEQGPPGRGDHGPPGRSDHGPPGRSEHGPPAESNEKNQQHQKQDQDPRRNPLNKEEHFATTTSSIIETVTGIHKTTEVIVETHIKERPTPTAGKDPLEAQGKEKNPPPSKPTDAGPIANSPPSAGQSPSEEEKVLHQQQVETQKKNKEKEAKEREAKERESKEREAKERESKERESKERESREKEAIEKEAKEKEQKEKESKEKERSKSHEHKEEGHSDEHKEEKTKDKKYGDDELGDSKATSTTKQPVTTASPEVREKNIPYYPVSEEGIDEINEQEADAVVTEAGLSPTEEVFDAATTSFFEGYGIAAGHAEDEFGGLGLIGVFEEEKLASIGSANNVNQLYLFMVLFLASWLIFNNRR